MNLIRYPIFISLLVTSLYSQINAKTNDGKDVILNDDGTWNYISKTIPIENNVSNEADEYDFRQINWGFSKAKVSSIEKEKIFPGIDSPTILAYDVTVGGLKALLGYYFINDKLFKAVYIFSETHSNKNDFIFDYNTINDILKSKYGAPKEDKTNWFNDLYKSDYQDYGMAVSLGHLSKYSVWDTPKTSVYNMLTGENFEISHKLSYESKDLVDEVKNQKETKNSSDF